MIFVISVVGQWAVVNQLVKMAASMNPSVNTSGKVNGNSEFKKHTKGKPLKSGEKRIVLNVFNALLEANPTVAVNDIVKLTAQYTGVSAWSVSNARKELKDTGTLSTPGKKRNRSKPELDKADDFVKCAIRSKVHNYFFNNEPPTIKKILDSVNSDPSLPSFKKTTFRTLLQEIGFQFLKRRSVNLVIDRDDIVLWRRRYLRNIRRYRAENKRIYYMDETWVNEGHTTSGAWADTTTGGKKKAFLCGKSTGPKNPTGKGKRLIIVHAGSDKGFVEGGLLCFESKRTGDYHEDMNGDVFREWFEKLLPKLEPGSIIVMDNASYHSVRLYPRPSTAWLKQQIMDWLTLHNIPFSESEVKAELLSKAQSAADSDGKKYVIDELAKQSGVTVERLPPYHSNLNAIETVWAFIKGFVARNNRTFKLREVRQLLESAISEVTPTMWENNIRHVILEEEKMWKMDGLSDTMVDSLVINLNSDSDDSDDSEDDDDMGVTALPDSDAD